MAKATLVACDCSKLVRFFRNTTTLNFSTSSFAEFLSLDNESVYVICFVYK